MIPKENILNAWIMCEHLSEGNMNLKDKKIRSFTELINNNYYDFFLRLINEELDRIRSSSKKAGIVVYFNIFEFSEVADILRTEYHLAPTEEEIEMGIKFGLAVSFDQHLNLNKDATYLTGSEYIRSNKCIPDEKIFHEYEDSLKLEIEQLFDYGEIPENEHKSFFNNAMLKLMEKTGASPDKCRIEFMKNLEDGTNNLHSFFISDLAKAKKIDTSNLIEYLYGFNGRRSNLDSKKVSQNFNAKLFEDILSPANYPIGRFPSNTDYALSFMQQVAVNLATGYDHRTIRSVNGPPGSGKTTLLKDIFAELIVKQAYDLANLSEYTIRGGEATRYYKNYSIGELPDRIAENNIVVASSNNGAVQNIVNELPLISKIDDDLVCAVKEADYFYELSNCKFYTKWKKDDSGKASEKCLYEELSEPDRNWGLFSMEGGRAENMNAIRSAINHIFEYLNEEYIPDPDIYKEFLKEYQDVVALRKKAADYAEKCKAIISYRKDYEESSVLLTNNRSIKENEVTGNISKLDAEISSYTQKQELINSQLEDIINNRKEIQDHKEQYESVLASINNQKPGIFFIWSKKREYNEMLNKANQKLLESIDEDKCLADKERELKRELDIITKNISQFNEKISAEKNEFNEWLSRKEHELSKLKAIIDKLQCEITSYSGVPLDMSLEYDELQMSAPWFNKEYRIAQSKLFITALRARKQFLFDNKDNIRAAFMIWTLQKNYLENKRLISAAWNWINFAIPVIGSTFASFGRMCQNLDENTIGQLFVDEAGQALPCAAVGAVFRSRNIMMVGDPSQIHPVQTLDSNIMALLSKHFEVDEKYLSKEASAQTLADSASQYGYYFDKDRSENSWIGIPLWVHRRCDYPMFTIANQISYFNMMVQGNKKNGKTGWFDIKGRANNKYVKEQGDFLAMKLEEMIKKDPEIIDKTKPDKVYVITPFRYVALMLAKRLEKIGFTRYDDKKKAANIGTIHTFQGKEAPIVFMVMGADETSKGAASWAVSEPNMMNVAATRAKNAFYIIGDKSLYKSLRSEVADDTIAIINKYSNEHPDLVDNNITLESSIKLKHSDNVIISGMIIKVSKGHQTNYAYIKGSDGKRYTVNEKMYDKIVNADKIIIEGNRVKFTPITSHGTSYATNISVE